MRRAWPFLFLLATWFLIGCGPQVHQAKFDPSKPLRAIVSLSPSTTEILGAIGGVSNLKGRTASDDYPATVKNVPIVATVKPDYELIKSMAPDLIIYDKQVYNAGDIEKIKAIGIETVEFDAKTVKDFQKACFTLADRIQQQSNVSDYVDRVVVAASAAESDKPNPPPKVAVIMPGHGAAALICGTDSFIADVIKIGGGEPVGPTGDLFVSLNPETLVTMNPDLIIVPTSTKSAEADVKELLNDPRLKSLKAIQKKNIRAMDQDVVLRRGARVDTFIKTAHRAITAKDGT